MSHLTRIDTQVRDLEAHRDACAELDLALNDNAEARGYAGHSTHVDHVIRLTGSYDVAVNQKPDGAHAFTADLWAGYVEGELGGGFAKLKQCYAVQKTTREARKKGLSVRRRTLGNGHVRLALCRV